MTDFNYPPQQTYQFDTERDSLDETISELEHERDQLEATDDRDGDRLQTVRSELQDARGHREAIAWAIEEFGSGATVTLKATTTRARSRAVDTAQRSTTGTLGVEQMQDWLLAASIVDAPWQDDDASLAERGRITGALPPALSNWLRSKQQSLNDLSPGN